MDGGEAKRAEYDCVCPAVAEPTNPRRASPDRARVMLARHANWTVGRANRAAATGDTTRYRKAIDANQTVRDREWSSRSMFTASRRGPGWKATNSTTRRPYRDPRRQVDIRWVT